MNCSLIRRFRVHDIGPEKFLCDYTRRSSCVCQRVSSQFRFQNCSLVWGQSKGVGECLE